MERQIPEGYEWPRFEAGGLVKCGDRYMHMDVERTAWHIVFDSSGEAAIVGVDGSRHSLDKGERVKRPPVIAGDGKPLEVGQTVWGVGLPQHKFEVLALNDINHKLNERFNVKCFDRDENEVCWCDPNLLTHKRPALDSDGVPIKKGDTVWHKGTGEKYRVFRFSDIENCVWGESDLGSFFLDCSMLTHAKPEPPDTWERIEEDVDALVDAEDNGVGSFNAANDYCERHGLENGTVWVMMARDLVRRCKEVARKENNNE